MKIKELQLVGPKSLGVRTYELIKLSDYDILVKVAVCGICPTEFPVYEGLTIGKPGASYRYNKFPCFLGHEVSGVVMDVGKNVTTFKVGDKVTGIPYSRSGFSSHVVEHEKYWRKISDRIDIVYSLGEPILCVENIINRANPHPENTIVLIGDGFISFLIIASLLSMGIDNIILVGHHDSRLKLGKELGARLTVNSINLNPYWFIRNYVGENDSEEKEPWLKGIDIVIDTTGSMSSLQLGASLLKPKVRAKLVLTGFYSEETFTLGHYLINRGPEIIVAYPSQSIDLQKNFSFAISKMNESTYPMDRLITHAFSFESLNDAFLFAKQRKDEYIKGVFCPDLNILSNNKKIKIIK